MDLRDGNQALAVTALGGSISTPKEGITAPVAFVAFGSLVMRATPALTKPSPMRRPPAAFTTLTPYASVTATGSSSPPMSLVLPPKPRSVALSLSMLERCTPTLNCERQGVQQARDKAGP